MPQEHRAPLTTFDAICALSQEQLEDYLAQYCEGFIRPPWPTYSGSWEGCMALVFKYRIGIVQAFDLVTKTWDTCIHPWSENSEEDAPLYTVGTAEEARRRICEIALWTAIGNGEWT